MLAVARALEDRAQASRPEAIAVGRDRQMDSVRRLRHPDLEEVEGEGWASPVCVSDELPDLPRAVLWGTATGPHPTSGISL